MHTEGLKKTLAAAGIILRIATQPLNWGVGIKRAVSREDNSENIIMLNPQRDAKTGQWFLNLWPGHEDNICQVLDADASIQQAVLLVKEPRRAFDTWFKKTKYREEPPPLFGDSAILSTHRDGWWIRQWTPEGKRHLLVGMDEREYFVATLPSPRIVRDRKWKQIPNPAYTVAYAMSLLKHSELVLGDMGKVGGEVHRQGEYFLLNPNKAEKLLISALLKKSTASVLKNTALGPVMGRLGGQPHVASEVLVIPESIAGRPLLIEPGIVKAHIGFAGGDEAGLKEMLRNNGLTAAAVLRWEPKKFLLEVSMPNRQGRRDVYMRGQLRHPNHYTYETGKGHVGSKSAEGWRRVLLNAEHAATAGRALGGGGWVD